MRSATPHLSCFLAEWYRPDLTQPGVDELLTHLNTATATMCAEGKSVQLLVTLVVPADEVLYGVFTAGSAELVTEACERAGIPVERLSADVGARINGYRG